MQRLLILALVAVVAANAGGPTRAHAAAANAPVFYVALGDSLATGAQPAPSGVENRLRAANGTTQGYVDVVHTAMRHRLPNLQLRNFACGGETTVSMIAGGNPTCGDVRTSQLADAISFLRSHQGEIAFVTIDIGANDLLAGGGMPAIASNLPVVLAAVHDALGPDVPIVGMTYYDPFVAPVWFGTHDPAAVAAEAAGIVAFNDFLESLYSLAGALVADVGGAFSVTDTTIQPDGLPLDVQLACSWTWMCSVGDIHANAAGYEKIAGAFLDVLLP